MLCARNVLVTFLLLGLSGACGGSKPSASGAAGAGGGSAGAGAGGGAAGAGAGAGGGSAGADAAASRDGGASDGAATDAADGPVCAPACGAGMTCLLGHCAPAPVELARIGTGCDGMALAINGGTLYFTDQAHGTVSSVATAGGAAPKTIATGQAMPLAIVADDTGVYWSNQGDNIIMKAPLPTGAAAPLLTALAPVPASGMALRAGKLFYSNVNGVLKVDTTMGASPPPALVGVSDGKPQALAIDDTTVYWVADLAASIEKHALDGTNKTDPVAESQGQLLFDAITVAGGRVVWAAAISVVSRPVDADGGTTPPIQSANQNLVTGLAATATTAYLGEDGTIEKASFGDDVGAVIADGQPAPGSFVLDATSLYWRTFDKDKGVCTVMKLAR